MIPGIINQQRFKNKTFTNCISRIDKEKTLNYTSRFSFLLFFFSLYSLSSFAQSWELGGFIGGSGYMGDLNPVNPFKFNKPAFGAQIKRNINPYWALKLNFTHGELEARDSLSDNAQFQRRNLSFFTPVTEISFQTELNFFKYVPSISSKRYTPYLFAGFGLVSFTPKTEYRGNVYELNRYGTEGQDYFRPYDTYALTVPYGAGLKFNFAGKWSLIAELGYRTAYTDYLDDVSGRYPFAAELQVKDDAATTNLRIALSDRSNPRNEAGTQRGDFRKRDTYMFGGLSITYSFFSRKCPVVE